MKIILNGNHIDPLKALTPDPRPPTPDLKKAARAFETYFIQSLLKEMRKTQPQGGILGGGAGKEIYQSLFDEKIAQKMTESGGIGLTNLILKKLSTGLKNSGESTDRKETIDLYHRLGDRVTKGVKDEDTRK